MATSLFLLLAFLPMSAQMRGGRAGGGGGFHGSVARGGGFRSAPATVYRGAPVRVYRGGPATFYHAPNSAGIVRRQVPMRHWGVGFGFGYGGYGYGGYGYRPYGFHHHHHDYDDYPYYGYPYAYSYYPYGYYGGYSVYDPSLYSDYSYYSNGYSNDNAYAQQTQQLSDQVSSLSQQMQDLREENDNLRDYIAEHNAAPAPSPDRRIPPSVAQPLQPPEPPAPPTTLVYKDGHTVEIHSYAIVGNALWILSEKHATKVPLADLDLDKTQSVNEQHGVEFTAPELK